MSAMITIKKKPNDVIVIDEDHGGYKNGHCIACGASGWITNLGYPHRVRNAPGAHLHHKKSCPMNNVLNDEGELKG